MKLDSKVEQVYLAILDRYLGGDNKHFTAIKLYKQLSESQQAGFWYYCNHWEPRHKDLAQKFYWWYESKQSRIKK